MTAEIPIIVMSGSALRDDELLRRFASVVLVKPLDVDELLRPADSRQLEPRA